VTLPKEKKKKSLRLKSLISEEKEKSSKTKPNLGLVGYENLGRQE